MNTFGSEDDPGYKNEGLNYMGAAISARIDEPGIGYGGITGYAISLTDPQGEYSAKVSTDYGKIVVESQTLKFPRYFHPEEVMVMKKASM